VVSEAYNKFSLYEPNKIQRYPAHIYTTKAAALHAFIRDVSCNQIEISKVAIFEDPFFAHVDVRKPIEGEPKKSLFGFLKPSKTLDVHIIRLIVRVDDKLPRQDFFSVNYKTLSHICAVQPTFENHQLAL